MTVCRTTRTRVAHVSRRQDGAAAVELALILPILILLLFGIVQFAIAFNHKQGLHAAAREGARLAALPQSTQSDVISKVEDALDGVVDPADATITVNPNKNKPCDAQPAGTRVTVTVQADVDLTIPLWPGSNPAVGITGKGEFRCE